ncbi:MAG TPA: HD-GYP domain-containing protein, partial [Gemmatimonadaceae bacterium]|nr:HD-GYP domain-containing protein [Gemmatimonadaceae bacterium]
MLLLAVLAMAAEALAFLMPHAARGSVAYIAYLASVLIAPGAHSVAAVLLVKAAVEVLQRREWSKRLFNVAQHGVSVCIATLLYVALGGTALGSANSTALLRITTEVGFPAFAAIAVSTIANTLLVVGVIAISKGQSLAQIFREVKLPMIGNDLLASPVVFLFAWVFSAYGSVAAACLWVPILGLRQLNKANVELAQMNRDLLQLMVKSIEARDPYTSGHSRRVQEYATIIARGLKLSDAEVDRISQAALLHDVGKIHEKYHPILTKPDRLTAEEWALMKEHPVDGASLVSTMTHLRHLVPAVRHHHENWDGTGYPDRIAGDAIPIAARIIRFADTIDAMTTERPYRGPLSEAQVRAEVLRCRGTQFDPMIADKLL